MFKLIVLGTFLLFLCTTLQGSAVETQPQVNRIGKTFDTPEGRLTISNEKLDWSEAIRVCNAEQMTLVTLDSDRKNILVKDLLVANGVTDQHWTSGNFIQGTFFWTSIGYPLVYTDWHDREPNQNWLEFLCVATNQTGWSDADCADANYFICE